MLFFSLWLLIILGIALWKFWPNPEVSVALEGPSLVLAPELQTIFERVELASSSPTAFSVKLYPRASYLAVLKGREQTISLGYQFTNERTALSSGTVGGTIRAEESFTTVQLQNPERVFARSIEFFLAH